MKRLGQLSKLSKSYFRRLLSQKFQGSERLFSGIALANAFTTFQKETRAGDSKTGEQGETARFRSGLGAEIEDRVTPDTGAKTVISIAN